MGHLEDHRKYNASQKGKETARRWYKANREYVYEKRKAWAIANRARVRFLGNRSAKKTYVSRKLWWDQMKNQPCTDCGVSYPSYVMQFDHIPERGPKLFACAISCLGRVRETVLAEIAKCELVCANCHMERTHQRRQCQRTGTDVNKVTNGTKLDEPSRARKPRKNRVPSAKSLPLNSETPSLRGSERSGPATRFPRR